jgi:hypothetical protein
MENRSVSAATEGRDRPVRRFGTTLPVQPVDDPLAPALVDPPRQALLRQVKVLLSPAKPLVLGSGFGD